MTMIQKEWFGNCDSNMKSDYKYTTITTFWHFFDAMVTLFRKSLHKF